MTMIKKDDCDLMSVVDYLKDLSEKTTAQICYIRSDALEAMKANPEGKNLEFYRLEVAMCNVELSARMMHIKLESEFSLDL